MPLAQTLQELRLCSMGKSADHATWKGRVCDYRLTPDFASMLLQLKDEAELTDDQSLLLIAGCVVTALAEEVTTHRPVGDKRGDSLPDLLQSKAIGDVARRRGMPASWVRLQCYNRQIVLHVPEHYVSDSLLVLRSPDGLPGRGTCRSLSWRWEPALSWFSRPLLS